jgi:serine/threonine protein kinase
MQYYDNGTYSLEGNEYPFVINEYMPYTLADMLKTKLTIVQKMLYSVQLLSAVSYLEEKEYVHRDIKPQNIFIKGNTCILGDFGLIKKVEDVVQPADRDFFKESQGPGMAFFYRTPDLIEYANGRSNLSLKTDVFQLGLVFAHMFTGFNPSQKPESYYSPLVLNEIKKVKGDLGYQINIQIQKMLALDPTDRPLASEIMAEWQSILLSAANMSKRVNGYSI